MNSKEQTKKKITVRDVMTIAAMMVLTIVVSGVTGPLTLPFPFLYLYVCAGLQMFLCATFYLVVANRLNKHGIFLVWGVVYGVILGLSGYMFLLPYFVAVAAICELAMLGKNTYINPLRNTIGWSIWGLGMVIGNAVPIWAAWDSYVEQASASGFSQEVFDMQINMLSSPWHILTLHIFDGSIKQFLSLSCFRSYFFIVRVSILSMFSSELVPLIHHSTENAFKFFEK